MFATPVATTQQMARAQGGSLGGAWHSPCWPWGSAHIWVCPCFQGRKVRHQEASECSCRDPVCSSWAGWSALALGHSLMQSEALVLLFINRPSAFLRTRGDGCCRREGMAERDHHRKLPSGSLWGVASKSSFWSCPWRSQVTASFHPASVFVHGVPRARLSRSAGVLQQERQVCWFLERFPLC